MAGKSLHIRYVLHEACPRAGPANAARKWDHQTAVPALIGADFQQFRRNDPVKPRPIGKGMGMMDLASQRRHQRDGIMLAFTKRADDIRN